MPDLEETKKDKENKQRNRSTESTKPPKNSDQPADPGESARPVENAVRTWNSADGKYSVEAILIDQTADTVRLKDANEQLIEVPKLILSPEDQKHLEAQE